MLRKKKITIKGDLSGLPKEKSTYGISRAKLKELLNPLTLRYMFILVAVVGVGVYLLFFAHAASDPYAPDYVPPVSKQQLIDDITMYHDGGHFPFTPPEWDNIQAPRFTELNTPGHVTPGSVALGSRTAGIYEWAELSTRENSPTNLNAVVEFREVGMAAYRNGQWETVLGFSHNQLDGPLKAIVNDVSLPSGFSQNKPGYDIGNNWSPSGNRMVGFGLGSALHKVGEPWPSNIPGWPEERLKAHSSIAGNSYSAGIDYCSRINCAGATIQAVQGWLTARVVTREGKSYQDLINAGDTAGAQQLKDAYYVLMPGWDQFTDQQVYVGTMGRARRVLPEWQTFTTTSMSQAQINGGLPAPPIPGYTTSGTTNQAPNVTLSSSPTSATTGQSYTLTATASDSDGSVSKIEIFQAGVSKKVCLAVTTCAFATSNTTAATYTYTAVATDNAGAATTSNSASVNITGSGTSSGKIYVVGDSWMERERDNGNLVGAIAAKGWLPANITINAYGGRSPADGLQTIANNATSPKTSNASYSVVNPSAVSQSDVIVINLGQNVCEWHGTDAELATPDTYGVNAFVTGIDPNCNNPGIHFTQAQYDATVTKMASLLNQINPRAKKIWIEPADPSNSLLQNTLATKAGPTISVNTSLFRNDIWNSVPSTYLDNSWHPTPYYAGILSGLIADAIGAPGTVTPPTGLSNGTYNDTDPAIGYTGSWTPDASSTSSYSGDEHYTNTPGDSATFQFTGEQLQLISHKNTDMGQATIKIDGVAQSNVGEWYANPAQTGVVNWTSNKLSKTAHTVVITVNATKNAASAGNYVSIDKIIISDAAVTTVVPGDVDGDGHVNLSDLSILGQNYGKSGQQKNQGNLDADANGVVNIYDLSILGQNWGK